MKQTVFNEAYAAPTANEILSRVTASPLPVNWRGGRAFAPAGLRKSRAAGDLGDFHSIRPFAPGDRVRSINWRATAATGAQEVLREVRLEEQPIDVFVIANAEASMDFGTVRALKRHVAAEVAAVIGLSTKRSKDRLGLITYSDAGVETILPTRSPEQQLLPAINAVLAGAATALSGAGQRTATGAGGGPCAGLRRALAMLPRHRSLVFIVSDFFECEDEAQQAALEAASRNHKLVAVHVDDPRENALPEGFGIISLAAGGGPERVVLLTSSCRRRFAAQARQRKLSLQALFERLHVCLTTLSTADQPEAHAQKLQAALAVS